MAQSVSGKQTTGALSIAEAELTWLLAGVCEMRGISQMWRWMLAEGVAEDMKVVEEIIRSDSKAGILKRSGSSRRTNHMKLTAFFLQAS